MNVGGFSTISNVMTEIGLNENWVGSFWEHLQDSEIIWGGDFTVVLVESLHIKSIIADYILQEEDEDNIVYIKNLNKFFDNYCKEYIIVE